MGFFSWKTQDTNESISNIWSVRKSFGVTMTDNKGNCWTEHFYDGVGIFGGKDFYVLLAEMNGAGADDDKRTSAIELVYSGQPYLSPNLTRNPDWEWQDKAPERCDYQGYFYD
jgi:hypothetical protein